MKFLKVIVIALITVFAFNSAEAQTSVRLNENPRKHRKVVVVERRAPQKPHHKPIRVKHHHRQH